MTDRLLFGPLQFAGASAVFLASEGLFMHIVVKHGCAFICAASMLCPIPDLYPKQKQ